VKLWVLLKRFRAPIAAIAAFGAILSGLLGYWSAYQTVEKVVAPRSSQAPSAADAATASGAPAFSIVILPFASHGGSAVDEQVAGDTTLDLTEAIGKQLPFAWVISPRLASTYRGKPNDPRALGRELNVRYVVEAELRRAGDRIALSAN
jgi:TolB-like protein